jgi:hypothetical protein
MIMLQSKENSDKKGCLSASKLMKKSEKHIYSIAKVTYFFVYCLFYGGYALWS